MDVSTQTLVETGLNVIGFLTAAGLLMLLTSRRNRRNEATETSSGPKTLEAINQSVNSIKTLDSSEGAKGANMSFVSFNSPSRVAAAGGKTMSTRPKIPSHLKGHAETIRLARQMLVGGSSPDEIKRSLPVTDGELALLQSA